MESKKYQTTLTYGQIKQTIELIESNNQYNEDKEEIKSWKKIVKALKESEEI
tara:strand:+ start:79 stop:234 length:156 start_codon:yes stop_codon:yes gene_type:complete